MFLFLYIYKASVPWRAATHSFWEASEGMKYRECRDLTSWCIHQHHTHSDAHRRACVRVCVGVPWRDCFHSHIPNIISKYNGFGKHHHHKCVDHRMGSGLIDATERVHWQHILGWKREKVRKRCFSLSYRRFSDICTLNRLYMSYVPGKSRNGCILSMHCWIKHLPVQLHLFPWRALCSTSFPLWNEWKCCCKIFFYSCFLLDFLSCVL